MHNTPSNPRSIAEEAIPTLYDKVVEKGLDIQLQVSPKLHRVMADRDRLEQVLINLLDNALKFYTS